VLRRVGELPGVESVGMSASTRTPFSGSGVTQRFTFVGESTAPADVRRAQFQIASPDYFATLRSPILSGRAFTPGDTVGASRVVIVNEAQSGDPASSPPRGHVTGGQGHTISSNETDALRHHVRSNRLRTARAHESREHRGR